MTYHILAYPITEPHQAEEVAPHVDVIGILKESKVPLTAEVLCFRLNCTADSVLRSIHFHWWDVEAIAGDSGWVYQLRKKITKYAPMTKRYNDQGITPTGARALNVVPA